MKTIQVKIDGQLVQATLHPGCYKQFPNGNVRGTAHLLNGHAVHVSKHHKASVYNFYGLVK